MSRGGTSPSWSTCPRTSAGALEKLHGLSSSQGPQLPASGLPFFINLPPVLWATFILPQDGRFTSETAGKSLKSLLLANHSGRKNWKQVL